MEKIMKTIIDIGSNSVRFLSDAGGSLEEKLVYTRLGEGTNVANLISEESYLRTLEGIRALLKGIPKDSRIFLSATSALREAKNRKAIEARFFSDLGLRVRVLSGEEEAYYNYLGARANIEKEILVLDIGGGSTELAMINKSKFFSHSLPIGAVRFYENPKAFLPLSEYFKPFLAFKESALELVGTGGTITSLAMVLQKLSSYEESLVDGYIVKRVAVSRLLKELENDPSLLFNLDRKRLDIFPSGVMLLNALMDYLKKDYLRVSTKDGLYGLYQEVE